MTDLRPLAKAAAAALGPSRTAALRRAVDEARAAGDWPALAGAAGALAQTLQHEVPSLPEALRLAEQALALLQAIDPLADAAWQAHGPLADVLDALAQAPGFDEHERAALRGRAAACREVRTRGPALAQAYARLPTEASAPRNALAACLARCFTLGGREDLARRFAPPAMAESEPVEPDAPVRCHDHVQIDWIFEPDLLVDGTPHRLVGPVPAAAPLGAEARPRPAPGLCSMVDADGRLTLRLPPAAPRFTTLPGCTEMRRTRRDVIVDLPVPWWPALLVRMEGRHRVADLLAWLPPAERPGASELLGTLVAAGALDLGGHETGLHLHALTKKGTLPGGALADDEVMRLATDRGYRRAPPLSCRPVDETVPAGLAPLHTLLRRRRSRRDFDGRPVTRAELDALLHTACGVTGRLVWRGRTLPLRAYPSSGGLYAVEVYPLLLNVQDMPVSLCQARPDEGRLALMDDTLDRERVIAAALPVERPMLRGAALWICLTGHLARHERKYGPGGYRMLVAEAGHLSQNLVLAATALGLSARPFGGVFDGLVNELLGIDEAQEPFLLSVLVGHAGDAAGE